jgi:hypothetical protein
LPETEARLEKMERMQKALHDLSQPLTALECGLHIGTMSPDGVREPTAEELLETILQALAQAERVTAHVRTMQELLNESEQVGI